MKISFSPPDISQLEIDEVVDTLKSGWITTGPKTKEFEKKLADFCGVKKAVCLNSQTACAEMALHVLGIHCGDEVITTSYTYSASAAVVCHVGATLKLVDIQKDNLAPDYEQIEKLINEKTKVIIPVDVGGIPCDYDKLFSIVERKKYLFKPENDIQRAIGRVIILADTAHALGAKYHNKMVGSIADFSAFSFHAVKNLTTAEGGMLCWKEIEGIDSDEIYKKIQLLSLHGQSKDAYKKVGLGDWNYDIVGTYYKCNMTDITASIGIAQLSRYKAMLQRRKDIIKKYDEAFHKIGILTLNHFTLDYSSSGHLYITRIPKINAKERQEIFLKMAEKGIMCNVHYKPLPLFTAYKDMGFDIKNYPNANNFFENEITLPLHTLLTDEQVDYIIENYSQIVKEYM